MMMHLTRHPIDVAAVHAEVQGPERGGTCVFVGTVRNDTDVTGIDYSAYDAMAFAEIERILGEASIAIAAAAPHRDDAFAACRFVIEAVKKRLPIWKKEYRIDGTTAWVDPSGKPVAHGP